MKYFNDLEFIHSCHFPHYSCRIKDTSPNVLSIEYVAGGSMYYQVDEQSEVILDRPAVHWHYRGHVYNYGPAGKSWNHYFVRLTGARADKIYKCFLEPFSDKGFCFIHNPDEYLFLFDELVEFSKEDTVWSHGRMVATVEQILAMLLGETEPRSDDKVKARIIELAKRVSSSPFEFYDLEQMAKEVHLSKPHFSRLFKKYVQKSPYDYALFCKMRYASRLLMQGNTSVTDVARDCGYDDLAQFSKLFHKQLKQWPSHFLKK